MNRICKIIVGVLLGLAFAGCEYTPISPSDPAGPDSPPGYAWEYSGQHLIAFSMQGCRQCEADKPELQRLEAQGVDVIHVTREVDPELFAKYGVKKCPYYMAMEDGEIKSQSVTLTVVIAFLKLAAWIVTTFL